MLKLRILVTAATGKTGSVVARESSIWRHEHAPDPERQGGGLTQLRAQRA